jgi:predicted NBD/HSP70 family sugar kinase
VRGLEAVAAADRGDPKVECGVARVAALVEQGLGRLVLLADLQQLLIGGVLLTEVSAEPALTVLNLLHPNLLILG